MSEPWVEKYRPRKLSEIVGQPTAISTVLDWARKWVNSRPNPPALLLTGPPGTGKTSTALALAEEMGWECVEINASEERTYQNLKKLVEGSMSSSLFGTKKLILLDEVDNVHGAEKGGYKAIVELIQTTANPVILTATESRELPEEVRELCLEVQFRRISAQSVEKVLRRICENEGIRVEEEVLKTIAESCEGDLRAAINDLQTTCAGKKFVSKRDLFVSTRIGEINIFQVLGALMKAKTMQEARTLLFSLDMPPDEALGWICENVPRMLRDPEDLERIYRILAEADLFRARTARRQAYKLTKYMCDLMTGGVAVSRKGEYSFVKFQFPTAGVLMSRTRTSREIRQEIAKKIAVHCHMSSHHAEKFMLPYLPLILAGNPQIGETLGLSEEELEFLSKLK